MFDIEKILAEYGLTSERYEELLKDCSDKVHKISDLDWSEINNKYGIEFNSDTSRKGSQPPLFGGVFVKEYFQWKNSKEKNKNNSSYLEEITKKTEELRKERIKLQTANIERNRIDRCESRQELYYEYVGNVIETLPTPVFKPLFECSKDDEMSYLVCLSDLHYGAVFQSENNDYSPAIFKDRLDYLTTQIYDFVMKKQLNKIHIACLGDTLQGLLRVSDLKINDSSVVKATVEVSRLIAQFLNSLSEFVEIDYYHVPTANHSQTRPIGSKASELADEDLEYVISHYIEDLCRNNSRVRVNLAAEGKQYIELNIDGYEILAMHGHQIKNIDTALKDLSMIRRSFCDYLILGHFHGGKELSSHEGCCHDTEILVCPSFVGSDPYSDSIMKGSKAAVKVFGFDSLYGHTETYKFILN